MALTVSRPRPGQLKMVSVTMAPASSAPNCSPTTVTIGTSALGSAWRQTTAVSLSPLARAVRMYSCPSSSSIAVRTMRVRIAASDAPIAIDGSTRYCQSIALCLPPLLAPDTGSHPSETEKIRISTGPKAMPGGKTEQAHHRKRLIDPAPAPHGCKNARGQSQHKSHRQRRSCKRKRIRIPRRDQMAHRIVQANRTAQVAMQNARPIAHVLHAKRQIESILMPQRANISRCGAVAEHLQDWIARHKVDEKKDQR